MSDQRRTLYSKKQKLDDLLFHGGYGIRALNIWAPGNDDCKLFCRALNQSISHAKAKSNIMIEEFKRGGRLRKKPAANTEDYGEIHWNPFIP